MQSINDLIFTALTREGFTGNVNQMLFAWLGVEGATADSLTDRWTQYFDILGIAPTDARADRQYLWLASLGHTQESVNDRLYDYWYQRSTAP